MRRKYVVLLGAYVLLVALFALLFRPIDRNEQPFERLVTDIRFGVVERIEAGNPQSKVHLTGGTSYSVHSTDLKGTLEASGLTNLPPIEERGLNLLKPLVLGALVLALPFAAFGGGMLFFDRRKNRRPAMMA
jgi:hypothetical protein